MSRQLPGGRTMRKPLTTPGHRSTAASVAVFVIVLSVGGCLLFSGSSTSSAAPGIPSNEVSAAADGLEALHQRAAARLAGDDDDEIAPQHAISPERAATI